MLLLQRNPNLHVCICMYFQYMCVHTSLELFPSRIHVHLYLPENHCPLTRQFGTRSESVILRMDSITFSNNYDSYNDDAKVFGEKLKLHTSQDLPRLCSFLVFLSGTVSQASGSESGAAPVVGSIFARGLGVEFAAHLAKGLADNWSQVRQRHDFLLLILYLDLYIERGH